MEFFETIKNISIVIGVIASVWKLFTFISTVQKGVENNEREIKRIKEKLENDYESINYLEKSNRHICRFMVDMCDHVITGNHVSKLEETRDDIIGFIAESR